MLTVRGGRGINGPQWMFPNFIPMKDSILFIFCNIHNGLKAALKISELRYQNCASNTLGAKNYMDEIFWIINGILHPLTCTHYFNYAP